MACPRPSFEHYYQLVVSREPCCCEGAVINGIPEFTPANNRFDNYEEARYYYFELLDDLHNRNIFNVYVCLVMVEECGCADNVVECLISEKLEEQRCAIKFTVYNDLGERLAEARIELNTGQNCTTDSNGCCTLEVSPGTYVVTYSYPEYCRSQSETIEIQVDEESHTCYREIELQLDRTYKFSYILQIHQESSDWNCINCNEVGVCGDYNGEIRYGSESSPLAPEEVICLKADTDYVLNINDGTLGGFSQNFIININEDTLNKPICIDVN